MKIKSQFGLWAKSLYFAILLFLPMHLAQAASFCSAESGKAQELCSTYCEELDCVGDALISGGRCDAIKSRYTRLTGESEFACEVKSLGCFEGNPGIDPPAPFDVGDGNDYGARRLELSVPEQCYCVGEDCDPCPLVVGYHGFGETGTSDDSWKSRLEPKGDAAGFISLYPTGDFTVTNYKFSPDENWAVPSCQDPVDGCEMADGLACDWCGSNTEPEAVSTQREIDFTKAIVKWTMDNHCVDPGQLFATGFSNGGLMSHLVARHPDTSGLFKAVVPLDGVDQAGINNKLKWIIPPKDGDSPWIMHVNEIFDRFEPYDGRRYTDLRHAYGGGWNPIWIYPPVLQIFAEYADKNEGYAACGFGPDDVGDRFGELDVGGVVPEGYRKLDGPNSLEGEGQNKFHCFTKDAPGASCDKLAICLWDSGPRGDDRPDPHARAGVEWSGGTDPGTGGTEPMDIMWRFMQRSVGVPY